MAVEKKFRDEIANLDLRALRNKGMKTVAQMDDLKKLRSSESGKDWTPDQETQFDKWDDECVEIEKEIRFKERQESFAAEESRRQENMLDNSDGNTYDPKFTPNLRSVNKVINKLQRGQQLSKDEQKIQGLLQRENETFEELFRNKLSVENLSDEQRAILKNVEQRVGSQSLTTTAGGFLVPQGFIPEVVRSMKYISAFFDEFSFGPNGDAQNTFTVYRTDAGNDLPIPTGDDTSNIGELLAENADGSSSTADLVFGQKTFKAYKYSTKMIKSSTELLQDSAIDIPGYISDMFASRLGRILNSHWTTGTGSSQPQGIITGATSGKVAGTSGTISFPEIVELEHSVDISYRRRPTCRFMMHDLILRELKKLVLATASNNNLPLWSPGWDQKAPATILGYQYLINNDMASTKTTGSKMMLFGDMKAYAIRLVNQVRVLRLAERYAEFDQTAWVGFMRADGRILNSAALKYYSGT
jgi:HK97 family phage major capsid protein